MDKKLIQHRTEVRVRKIRRLRARIEGTPARPRLAVSRTDKHIYAQVIDDTTGQSLVQVSTLTREVRELRIGKKKTQAAQMVGTEVAKRCLAKGILSVAFDRRGFMYHGRVKALAEAARAGGLKF